MGRTSAVHARTHGLFKVEALRRGGFAGPANTAKTVSLIDAWVCDTVVNDPLIFLVQISQDKAAEFN